MSVNITASDVNKLRQMTGAGMMDCRNALQESNGDFEAAVDFLRKKGQKVAAKRSDRDAKEGLVIAKTTADSKTGIIINLTSETDFVSKNEEFIQLGLSFSDVAIANNCKSLEELKACSIGNITVEEKIMETVAKIGEKIDITTFERLDELSKTKGALRGVPTGLTTLDKMLFGLKKGELIILAARPSVGKSSFAHNILQHASIKHGKGVLLFSSVDLGYAISIPPAPPRPVSHSPSL